MTTFVALGLAALALVTIGGALMLALSEGETTFRVFGALAHVLILFTLGFWVLFEPEAGDGQVVTTVLISAAALVEILIYVCRLEWLQS
jgi:hypothetical protein